MILKLKFRNLYLPYLEKLALNVDLLSTLKKFLDSEAISSQNFSTSWSICSRFLETNQEKIISYYCKEIFSIPNIITKYEKHGLEKLFSKIIKGLNFIQKEKNVKLLTNTFGNIISLVKLCKNQDLNEKTIVRICFLNLVELHRSS